MNTEPIVRAIKAQEELCLSLAQQLRKSKSILKIMHTLQEVMGVMEVIKTNNTTIEQPNKRGRKFTEAGLAKRKAKEERMAENERRKALGLQRYSKPRVKVQKEITQKMSTKTHAIQQVYEKKENTNGPDINKMREFLKHNPHGSWLGRTAKDRPK